VILVFGGLGQLGQELSGAAQVGDVPLAALSRQDADIASPDDVRRALARHRPSIVVNAAAYTKVDLAESEPDEARRVNETGAGLLASACAEGGVPIVHLSTDFVFDGQKPDPYVETDPVAPLSVYGRTKAAGEDAVRSAAARHVIIRTSWVYGPYGQNFLKTMLRLARERDELRVVADQHGAPTSTRDLARVILAIAPRLAAGEDVWGTYHFAGQGYTTWHGFAAAIVAVAAPTTGRRPPVTAIATAEYPTPARRPANSRLDCGAFARAFGLSAHPWQKEMQRAVEIVLRDATTA
jgi:dTDP-4-dehydrorhamnose reductase